MYEECVLICRIWKWTCHLLELFDYQIFHFRSFGTERNVRKHDFDKKLASPVRKPSMFSRVLNNYKIITNFQFYFKSTYNFEIPFDSKFVMRSPLSSISFASASLTSSSISVLDKTNRYNNRIKIDFLKESKFSSSRRARIHAPTQLPRFLFEFSYSKTTSGRFSTRL